ncbi:MAG: hypothetical protein KGM24_09865, partial [Elusimicrobia bacterium]|nr:hypothetical protein [Elusimicrobiota bacterium]
MIRRVLAALLAASIAVPSFAGPVELARPEVPLALAAPSVPVLAVSPAALAPSLAAPAAPSAP